MMLCSRSKERKDGIREGFVLGVEDDGVGVASASL